MVAVRVMSMEFNVPNFGLNWSKERGLVMPVVPGPQSVATRTPGGEVDCV